MNLEDPDQLEILLERALTTNIRGVMVLKKISLILSFLFLSIGLFGCQQINEDKSDNAPSNTDSIEKVHIYEMKSFSEVNEVSPIIITDSEEINSIEEAINDAQKVSGIVDMADPEFKIEFGKATYFLWISEESGTIMNTDDTHTIYSLSEQSIKQVNEIIKNKFSKEESLSEDDKKEYMEFRQVASESLSKNTKDTVIGDWPKAEVIEVSPADVPQYIKLEKNQKSVKVVFNTEQDSLLGPIGLYIDRSSKEIIGSDARK